MHIVNKDYNFAPVETTPKASTLLRQTAGNVVSGVKDALSKPIGASPTATTGASTGQSDLASALRNQQSWYADQLKAQQQAQQQAAQNAYDSNMSALQSAYQQKLANLDSNLNATKSQLTSSYNDSAKSLNDSASKALQEAYISRMMSEKKLPMQLSAQGINGGATESAVASLMNNYGNARNNIETSRQDNLRQLEAAYNNNMANAMQSYNDAVSSAADANMSYRMQLENDLANNTVGSYQNLYNALANMDGNYVNAMSNYVANQADRSANLQYALQKQILENALDGTPSIDGATAYYDPEGVTRAQQLANAGFSFDETVERLRLDGYTDKQIGQFFANAGLYAED